MVMGNTMKIIYVDDYGELVFESDGLIQPSNGDTVVIDNEDWVVKHRTIHPDSDSLIVSITQNLVRSGKQPSNDSGRLNEMHSAIISINKRQDASEKKGRALNEQISSMRKHINTRIQQEKKEKE
jgi:hypothetical protein